MTLLIVFQQPGYQNRRLQWLLHPTRPAPTARRVSPSPELFPFRRADPARLAAAGDLPQALHHVFAADAHRGKTSVGWFYGFRLQLVVNDRGELLAFCLTLGNVDDRLSVPRLVRRLFGKLFGDRGYISQALGERSLLAHGVLLITTVRKNVRERLLAYTGKLLRRKRTLIESVNDQLKNICQIEHSRHRSPYNFLAHLLSGTGRLLPPAQEAVAALGP